MHVHISPVEVLSTAATIVVFGFVWRSLTAKLIANDSTIGKAMAFVY